MPLRNLKTGRFRANPKGIKTDLMKKTEKKLGHSLKKDWDIYYRKKRWGLKKMAARWRIKRSTLRGFKKRQGWVGILGLELRKKTYNFNVSKIKKIKKCEVCGANKTKLQKSHFIPRSKGGPDCFFNILHLCPNCHDRLDNEDNLIIKKARKILLSRSAKALNSRLPPWRQ